jgi:hypothetical protein
MRNRYCSSIAPRVASELLQRETLDPQTFNNLIRQPTEFRGEKQAAKLDGNSTNALNRKEEAQSQAVHSRSPGRAV